eukprot:TRINITY_DN2448_c1_g1_i4.p1 TRINITY_DN2448_c1_g1~~TRINITY_DN2448_c1_g1_i4.p1  ORF type:complete len:247 (-),score=35.39 TRINITY_DN2448_c1_g1_i4:35-775(-)
MISLQYPLWLLLATLWWAIEGVDLTIPVGEILHTASENKEGGIYLYNGPEAISSLLKPFSLAVHRVLVKLDDKHIEFERRGLRLVSQTDILNYCNNLPDSEKPWANVKSMTLKELNIINKNPVSCETDKTAVEAFKLIGIHNTSALCVLEPDTKKVVANLSASDLRGIDAKKMAKLNLPVLEFLQSLHWFVPAPIIAQENDTLEAAINKCLENHIHRLWVVSEDGKLTGVVSLTDFFVAISAAYHK